MKLKKNHSYILNWKNIHYKNQIIFQVFNWKFKKLKSWYLWHHLEELWHILECHHKMIDNRKSKNRNKINRVNKQPKLVQ